MWREDQSVREREGEEGERAREGRRMSGSKKDTRAREGKCVERREGATLGYHTG